MEEAGGPTEDDIQNNKPAVCVDNTTPHRDTTRFIWGAVQRIGLDQGRGQHASREATMSWRSLVTQQAHLRMKR